MVDLLNKADACAVCRILGALSADQLILDDPSWVANGILDVPGWVMVSTRRHCEGLWSISDDETARLGVIMRDLAIAAKAATGAERIHVASQGEIAPHFHYMMMPRLPGEEPVFDRDALMVRAARDANAASAADVTRRIREHLRQRS